MQKITIDVKRETFDVAAVEGSANSIQILFINSPEEWGNNELSVYALFSKGDKGEVHLVDKSSMAVNVPNFAVAENAGFKVTLFAMNSDATTPYRYVMPPVWVQVKEGYECDAIIGPSKDNMDAISTLIQTMQTNITVYDQAESVRADAETERVEAENKRVEAENIRAECEADRATAEAERSDEEGYRVQVEEERVAAEDERSEAERVRKENESARIDAEEVRVENENERISSENLRVAAELDRQAAEDARIAYINSVIASKFDVASGLSKDYTDRLAYYDDPNIKPTDANCFSFTLDDETMTASIRSSDENSDIYDLTDLVIPYHYTIGDKTYTVIGIEDEAFMELNVKSVIIPNTITTIGVDAFCACWCVTEIKIPNSVVEIKGWAFSDLLELSEIVLPKNLKILGEGTLGTCYKLKTVIIPDGVTTIENMAFYECQSLESVVIPTSVESIGTDLFYREENENEDELPWITVYYNGTPEQWSDITNDEDVFGYDQVDIVFLGSPTQEYVDEVFGDLRSEIDSLFGKISDAYDEIGDLGELTTSNNDSLVDALNEVTGKKADKTILLTKTKKIYQTAFYECFIEDNFHIGSEIKLKFTRLIPGQIYYIDFYFNLGTDGYIEFTPDNEGNATATLPTDQLGLSDEDVLNKLGVYVAWHIADDDDGVYDYSLEGSYIIEYTCSEDISDAIAGHEALINDIDIALDNVIAKYELGGDV